METHFQELAAIQAAGKAQNADTLNQSATAGQELGGTARARQEEIDRQRWQRVEENRAAEQRRRKALRETAGWVYLPELLQFLKQGRG
jgi:hypothetical protein